MNNLYKRSELYYCNLQPSIGSEQKGVRPVLVIQNDVGNLYSPTLIVAAITSHKKPSQPTHVSLQDVPELEPESVVMLEQCRTIDKQRILSYIGMVNDVVMHKVDQALMVSVGLWQARRESMILCLCGTCSHYFYSMPGNRIRRIDPVQKIKDTCTYCGYRMGFDYEIISKQA